MHHPLATTKNYWENPFSTEFHAEIVDCEVTGNSAGPFRVCLSETAFYPEGGGQPADQGWLNDCPVIYVEAVGEKIWHTLSTLPEGTMQVGGKVFGKVHWPRRFDHMQQHLGQHLLSAVLFKDWSANTIGFHMGESTVTIDLDENRLTATDYTAIENTVNQLIYENRPVTSRLISNNEYQQLSLRKTPELSDPVRIVSIEGVDESACGGTHPSFTGAVGLVKILKTEAYKGGTRVTFVCGQRALSSYQQMQLELDACSTLLSVGRSQVSAALISHQQDYQLLKKNLKQLQAEWCQLESQRLLAAAQTINGHRLIRQTYSSLESQQLQALANHLKGESGCVVLLAAEAPSLRFIMTNSTGLSQLSMKELMLAHLHLIEGKGGGNAASAQGGGSLLTGLPSMLDSLETAAKTVLQEAVDAGN